MLGDLLVSAQQAAHKWLREMILSGELPAGQALRQEEIARRLGISRLPIREALNRLATEGLVELKPRRGFYVASLNIDEIEDIFEMRAMLGGACWSSRHREDDSGRCRCRGQMRCGTRCCRRDQHQLRPLRAIEHPVSRTPF